MKEGVENLIKFKNLKRRLKMPEWQVIGILESIWKLTRTSSQAGDIGRYSNEDIAAAIEYAGDADELIDALVKSRWLDEDPEFRLIVHDWSQHVPNYLKGNFAKHDKTFVDVIAKQRAGQPAKQGGEPAKQPALSTLVPSTVQYSTAQPNQLNTNDPSSSSTHSASAYGGADTTDAPSADDDDFSWDDVRPMLTECGIARVSDLVEKAARTTTAARAELLCGIFKTYRQVREWTPGALHDRILNDTPESDGMQGWPGQVDVRPKTRKRREWHQVEASIRTAGKRGNATDEDIEHRVASAKAAYDSGVEHEAFYS